MPGKSVRYCSILARGLESPSRPWRSSTRSSTTSLRGLQERRARLPTTRRGPASLLVRSRLQSSFSCQESWQMKQCLRASKLYAVTPAPNKKPCLSCFQLASYEFCRKPGQFLGNSAIKKLMMANSLPDYVELQNEFLAIQQKHNSK